MKQLAWPRSWQLRFMDSTEGRARHYTIITMIVMTIMTVQTIMMIMMIMTIIMIRRYIVLFQHGSVIIHSHLMYFQDLKLSRCKKETNINYDVTH